MGIVRPVTTGSMDGGAVGSSTIGTGVGIGSGSEMVISAGGASLEDSMSQDTASRISAPMTSRTIVARE
jgi:hypothetical protein